MTFSRLWFLSSILVSFCLPSAAQPVVASVTNGADFTLSVAPGTLATIFGSGLAASTASASSTPLPKSLGGATVFVNSVQAPLLYASSGQINFQMPFGTAAGAASLTVTVGPNTSSAFGFNVAASAIGLFQDTKGHAIVQNHGGSLNSTSLPATGGSVIVVYLTGIGAVTPAVADGAAAPVTPLSKPTGTVTASIGDNAATVQFIGLTPGFVGLAQANIQVPQLNTGDYPLTITLGGALSASAFVSVTGTGAGYPVAGLLTKVGTVSLAGGVLGVQQNYGVVNGGIALLRNYLYVCGPSNIHIVDLSVAATPNDLGEFGDSDLGGNGVACSIDQSSTTPFLLEMVFPLATPSLVVYDLTDPTNPIARATIQAPFGYLTPAIQAFNLSVGFLDSTSFQYSSTYSIQSTTGNLGAVDYTTLTSPIAYLPVQTNSLQPATNNTNHKFGMVMVPGTNFLYVAGTTGSGDPDNGTGALDIFDVTVPSAIQGVLQLPVQGTEILQQLAIDKTQLLAAGGTLSFRNPGIPFGSNGGVDFGIAGSLTITLFDISNTVSPVIKANVTVPGLHPQGLVSAAAVGGGFYAISGNAPDLAANGGGGPGSLIIVDARPVVTGANPQVATYANIQGLNTLIVADGFLIAATENGANIYQINIP